MTEREKILAQRQGFIVAYVRNGWSVSTAEQRAKAEYPMPKVTRPREVKSPYGVVYRINGGKLQMEAGNGQWASSAHQGTTVEALVDRPENYRWLFDLIQRPTEEVEID